MLNVLPNGFHCRVLFQAYQRVLWCVTVSHRPYHYHLWFAYLLAKPCQHRNWLRSYGSKLIIRQVPHWDKSHKQLTSYVCSIGLGRDPVHLVHFPFYFYCILLTLPGWEITLFVHYKKYEFAACRARSGWILKFSIRSKHISPLRQFPSVSMTSVWRCDLRWAPASSMKRKTLTQAQGYIDRQANICKHTFHIHFFFHYNQTETPFVCLMLIQFIDHYTECIGYTKHRHTHTQTFSSVERRPYLFSDRTPRVSVSKNSIFINRNHTLQTTKLQIYLFIRR